MESFHLATALFGNMLDYDYICADKCDWEAYWLYISASLFDAYLFGKKAVRVRPSPLKAFKQSKTSLRIPITGTPGALIVL